MALTKYLLDGWRFDFPSCIFLKWLLKTRARPNAHLRRISTPATGCGRIDRRRPRPQISKMIEGNETFRNINKAGEKSEREILFGP